MLFYRQKKYAEAVPFLEFVTELDPSRTEPLLRLGTSYMKMGDEAKGIAMFRKVLTLDSSAASLNGIAYELADANTILPEALAYAEKAVRQQEDASQKVRLSILTVEDLKGIQKIGSYWDTLGWVHFRMGNLDRAEKYLRASWQLTQDPTAADHLGQLYAQQQKRSEAIHMYRLGLAALESANSQGEHEEIQNHLALLLPGTNLSTGVDLHRGAPAGEELSSMRAVKLPRVVTGPANAEFFLLFGSDGKPQDVKFISGSDQLKSADKQIRAAVYPVSYPEGSAARLVRRAILSCSSLSGCEIVLYNPDSVNSIQ
jgi:tetratricopeptide (TPR) repeat protein